MTVSDPIGSGLAASLAHLGGNITGFTFVESSMGGKWAIAPRTERLALLFNPATALPLKFYLPSIEAAASSFSIDASTARCTPAARSKARSLHWHELRAAAL